ncbi:MAG: IS66 family transposase [Atopobiaceae bacterium]|nr:IS66 family transposase [Atopobiaceae bacterium]
MGKANADISSTDCAALLERVAGLEAALAAVSADNAQLAAELERERSESAARTEAAVAEAVAAVRAELQAVIDSQGAENARLVEQFKLLQQSHFGSRSERVDPSQLSLFNDVEAASDGAPDPSGGPDGCPAPPARPKARHGAPRKVDMSKLETVVVEHDIPEGERGCPACGTEMAEVRVEVTRKLRIVPAHLVCEEHRTHVYVCPACSDANSAGEEAPAVLVRAPRPAEAFPRSLATPSLAAWAIDQKYCKAMPLYRIERGLADLGCGVSRADLSNWVMLAWERWLVHIRDGIRSQLLSGEVIHADETPVQVLREPGREACSKSYCWVFCAPACDRHAYDYVYAPTRSGEVVAAYLSGWSGTLVTDGYRPYFSIDGVTNVACLAHVRRRFATLVKLAGGDAAAGGASGDPRLALDGRRYVDRIFRAEDGIGDVAPDERARLRAGDVGRAMREFESWCRAMLPHATPGLKLEEALRYALAYMPYVRNAIDEGRAELTNNRAERAVKPFVLGRKNWLFSNTPRGAEASCGIYSVVTTARECGLSPMAYVEWVLSELPLAGDPSDPDVAARFLPWSDEVPDRLRVGPAETEDMRATQEEPIADVDPGAMREDE